MAAVQKVLVVGAGSAGCAAAGFLAGGGVAVDLVELQDDVTALGSGITVQGNALRVLRDLGVWEMVRDSGFGFATTGIRTAAGPVVAEIPDVQTGGPDLPSTMGMERQKMAAALVEAASKHGTNMRFGLSVQSMNDDGSGVDVVFTDGSTGRYDFVIGADGLRSQIRSMIGITDKPEPVGMGIFRVFTSRPESVVRTDLCFDGACYIAGYCPTGEDSLYAYLVEDKADWAGKPQEELLAHMRELAANYHGTWDEIRERMTDPSRVHYTWFEKMVVADPWYRGRVALIGDAAHTCPPTLAQGAAMALEDASVLAECLLNDDDLDSALAAFMARRLPRAKAVVDASVQLAQWMLDHDPNADVPGTMGRTLSMLTAVP